MARETRDSITSTMDGTIDIAKLLMAILVIGIHTEPFGFNFWLDKAFGIVTRLCVPFFFVTSAYFFGRREKAPTEFLKRILILYFIWTIIYLPFDLKRLGDMTTSQILVLFFWEGNEHALWYLCGTIIGFLITWLLLKIIEPKYIFIIALLFLIIGTAKSTYSSALQNLFGISLPNHLGSRNGLFYGFPYISLGMLIAKSENKGIYSCRTKLSVGLIFSVFLLAVESYLCVIRFKTGSTILWLSVLPYTYFFFEIILNTHIKLSKSVSLTCRKASTLMYVSQYLFIPTLSKYASNMTLFVLAVAVTGVFSLLIIKLSEIKNFELLKYLY